MAENGMTKKELIELVGKETAEKIWTGWNRLEKNPTWNKNTRGKTWVDLLGR